ncbi:hypothetical protein RHSIM_Rhsim12G0031700 [Rhododendron simsii]|uniref:SWIM-type domain-containing protein n=1 Tax=Rhododendron simsii TaxID=118357 RepID=A0A834G205_RHOSS|nr:hypothetical protein RHSIM_Rhsim12G0031700 [Rhododendron simsii]
MTAANNLSSISVFPSNYLYSDGSDTQHMITESLLNTDDSFEEMEKLAFISSCIIDSVKAGGSVLIPIGQLGNVLQHLECISCALRVIKSEAGCYGVEVIDVTVVNSGGSNGCFESDAVTIGVDCCESNCLTTDVGSVGLCGGSSGSYGSIFTSSKGKGSAVSCLTIDVGSVGLFGGSSGSYGSIFTSSKGKGPGVSCLGDVVASGVSGSRRSSDGLCTDVGSCSSSKGKVNQKFEGGAVEFRDKLAKFAIFYGFEYSFAKNEKDRVTAFCKDANCKWRVHARLDKVSCYFYICSFDDIHSCGVSVLTTKHSRASSNMIGRLMSADIRTTSQKRPIDVVSSLKGLCGVDVPYKRVWKGVEKGRSEAFGNYDASFDELRWYREAVRNSDPESVFEIEVDIETNRFQRNAGIKAAVPRVFPSGFHGYCLYHLKNTLRGRLTGGRNKLKKAGGEARITNFLADLPYEHWANAFFPGQHYGEMWSNLTECFNSWIEKERHLPITQLVDRARIKLMEQMCCRKQTALKWRQVLCPTMDEALAIAFQESKAWEVKFSSPDVLEFLCNPSVKEDIGRHSCTCTQCQLNGVPCAHAICAIKKSGKSLNACVECYFHVECYREAYSRPIMPVPTLWKPEVTGDAVILPHVSRRPPGRNKKKRIRSFGEKVRPINVLGVEREDLITGGDVRRLSIKH